MKTALVLSGGSIKGAFQAGAINVVLHAGFEPSGIYGVSVGSLNGGFLADRAGKAARRTEQPSWPAIADELKAFWFQNITSFGSIGKKRKWYTLGYQILFNKFNGLIDTKKLKQLIDGTFSEADLAACEVPFKAASVNLRSSELIVADKNNSHGKLRDYILASTAIPIVMPVSKIDDVSLVDGGTRDVAPMKAAIDDGANHIICILCQEKELGPDYFQTGKITELAERIMEIVTNEMVNNDIARANTINELVRSGRLTPSSDNNDEYRHVPIKVIRPSESLNISLADFDREDITRIYRLGQEAARRAIGA